MRHKCKDCGGRNAPLHHRNRPSGVRRLETPEQRTALSAQRARKRKAMGVPEPAPAPAFRTTAADRKVRAGRDVVYDYESEATGQPARARPQWTVRWSREG